MKKAGLLMGLCIMLAGGLSAALTKGPYLIYTGSSSGMTVMWQTDVAQSCTLYWGTSTNYSSGNVSSSEINTSHQHKKALTGLAVGTRYYYKVVAGSATHTGNFKTSPSSSATDVKFLVYGDTRTNVGDHNTVASRIVSTFTADSAYQTFLLHVGDFVSSGNTESYWTTEFFPRNQASIMELQSKIPIVGTRGNHEGSTAVLYQKYFPYPYVADRYWSFDYGPVHVCVIDQGVISMSDDVAGFTLSSTQKNWLINDLSSTSRKWKVILLHHPGWSASGGHANNNYVINTLHPLFKQYGVAAVFGGHNHYYARATVDGIHYVTSGGGGAPLATPVINAPIVTGTKTLQLCKVKIIGDVLTCNAIKASDSSVIDTFTVTKSSGTTTTVPWVTNLTESAAGTSITNAGLVVSGVSRQYHATVPAGSIFSQTPGGNTTVNLGSSVALACSLGPQSSTTNLVINGSFETDTNSWKLVGSAYRTTSMAAGGGIASLRINTASSSATQYVAIVSGKTYDISVNVNVSARTAGNVVFDTGDKYDGAGQGQFVFSATNGGWKVYSGSFTATNNFLTVRMFSDSAFAGTAYFDLIELEAR